MQRHIQSMSINELQKYNYLSVGAGTVCMVARLNTTQDIIAYYIENNTFLDIRTCGNAKNNELMAFCQSNLGEESTLQTECEEYTLKHTTSVLELKNRVL